MDQSITISFKPLFAGALGMMSIDKITDWGMENNNKFDFIFVSSLHGMDIA